MRGGPRWSTRLRGSGFTLIEIMIVVALMGIFAMVAVPAYTEYIAKSRRGAAIAGLLEAAQALERYYSVNGHFTETRGGNTLPDVFTVAAPPSGTTFYTIAAIGAATDETFTLRATRAGAMAGDACGDFQITQSGTRSLSDNTRPVEDCWRDR